MVSVGLLLIAVGLFSMQYLLEADSSYVDLVWPLLIMSTGIGFCIAPTTSAIMNAVPDEKQGVASAVNDATREVGAALGIAVAGSMLAAQYTAFAGSWAELHSPRTSADAATDSLAEALAVAEQLGPQGPALPTARRVGVPGCDGPFADRRVDGPGCRRPHSSRSGRQAGTVVSCDVRCPARGCTVIVRRR